MGFTITRDSHGCQPRPNTIKYRPVQLRVGRHYLLLLAPFFFSVCASPPRGVIVFCAGDSITAEAYPHYLQQLLNRDGIRARVLNFGRSGYNSGEYLRFLANNEARLKTSRPDFVLLQLGTNDVRVDADRTAEEAFKNNLEKMIAIFQSFRGRSGRPPRILLALVPPVPETTPFPFSPDSSLRIKNEINPAVQAICAEHKIPLVDNYSLFLREPGLLPGVHPSREGYLRLAENWLSSLKPLF